jgi:hypothetical protein
MKTQIAKAIGHPFLLGLLIWLVPYILFGPYPASDSVSAHSRWFMIFPFAHIYLPVTLIIVGAIVGAMFPKGMFFHPFSILAGELSFLVPLYLLHPLPDGPAPKMILFIVSGFTCLSFVGSIIAGAITLSIRKCRSLRAVN